MDVTPFKLVVKLIYKIYVIILIVTLIFVLFKKKKKVSSYFISSSVYLLAFLIEHLPVALALKPSGQFQLK